MSYIQLTLSQAQRDPDEEGDYMAFEQLMADAAIKKDKKAEKKDKKEAKKADAATSSHGDSHEKSKSASSS